MKKYKKIILVSVLFILIALPVSAQIKPLIGKGGYVPCATDATAVLNLDCFLDLLGGVSKLILGLTGSLALLYFVYGGIVLLTSGGNESRITNGKTILSHAIIGVIIIFGAYLLVITVEKIAGVNLGANSGLNTSIDPNKINTAPPSQNTGQTGGVTKYYCIKTTSTTTSGPKPEQKTVETIVGTGYSNEKDCMDYCVTQVVQPKCQPKTEN